MKNNHSSLLMTALVFMLMTASPARSESRDDELRPQNEVGGFSFFGRTVGRTDDDLDNRKHIARTPEAAALSASLQLVQKGSYAEALGRQNMLDSLSRKIVEWAIMRKRNSGMPAEKILAFTQQNPHWPSPSVLVSRAEEALADRSPTPGQTISFFQGRTPQSGAGKLLLARALASTGETRQASGLARDLWRNHTLSKEAEDKVLAGFSSSLTPADHKARMDTLLFEGDRAGAARAAARLGKGYIALANGFSAAYNQAGGAERVLASVPTELRKDALYLHAMAQIMRRKDRPQEAAQFLLAATHDPKLLGDPDEWWIERRLVARKLLDIGDARLAYRVAREHSAQSNSSRVDAEFHAGWIALRFLRDSSAAEKHFAEATRAATTPISLARAYYWLGRAQEASGGGSRAYAEAARYSTTYYGQLAAAKVGGHGVRLNSAPRGGSSRGSELAQAVRVLYAADFGELARIIISDSAQRLEDAGDLAALGDVASAQGDMKGLLIVGKSGMQRGKPMDEYAFPNRAIPSYQAVGGGIERAVVFAIARQESEFNPGAVSHAGARGLMQMMPATAAATARKFGVSFDRGRLMDPSYNAMLGSAHLGELAQDYGGSYILTFAAYNAGPGNVKKWIAQYGDPRSSLVDPIDWVERIPFYETRNYVQRVMENVQVYRARLASNQHVSILDDIKRGGGR